MGAGNPDKLADRYRKTESFSPPRNRDTERACVLQLWMVALHRRSDDHFAHVFHVRGIVPVHDVNSEPLEVRGGRCRRIAAAHRNSAAHEQLGERAHSRAGNADEVNRA